MSGLFGDIETDVEDIEVGLPRIKVGAYEFQLTDVTVKDFADDHETMGGQRAIIFEYTVIGGEESELGKTFDLFTRQPNEELQPVGSNGKGGYPMFASMLKQAMQQIGIPDSQLNKWDPENQDDLDAVIGVVGKGNIVRNKKNPAYDNLYNFELTEESGASDTEVTPTSTKLSGAWKR